MKKISQFKLKKIGCAKKICQQIDQVKQIKKKHKSPIIFQISQRCLLNKQLKQQKSAKKDQIKLSKRQHKFITKQIEQARIQNIETKKQLVIHIFDQASSKNSLNFKKHIQINKYKTPFNPFEQILLEDSKNNSCIQIGNNCFDSQFSNIQMKSPTFSDIFNSTKSQNQKIDSIKYFKNDHKFNHNHTDNNFNQKDHNKFNQENHKKLSQILIQNVEELDYFQCQNANIHEAKYNQQYLNDQKTEIWNKIKEFNFKIPQILIKKQEINQNQIPAQEEQQSKNYQAKQNQANTSQKQITNLQKQPRKQISNLQKQLEQIYNGKFKLQRV